MSSNNSTSVASAELNSAATIPTRFPRISTTLVPYLRSHYALVLFVVGVYWVLLFVLTHIPATSLPRKELISDKVAHFIAYGGLSFLIALSYRLQAKMTLWGALTIVVAAALYGAVDELTQGFVPGRVSDWNDWLADLMGAVLGVALLEGLNSLRPLVRWFLARRAF